LSEKDGVSGVEAAWPDDPENPTVQWDNWPGLNLGSVEGSLKWDEAHPPGYSPDSVLSGLVAFKVESSRSAAVAQSVYQGIDNAVSVRLRAFTKGSTAGEKAYLDSLPSVLNVTAGASLWFETEKLAVEGRDENVRRTKASLVFYGVPGTVSPRGTWSNGGVEALFEPCGNAPAFLGVVCGMGFMPGARGAVVTSAFYPSAHCLVLKSEPESVPSVEFFDDMGSSTNSLEAIVGKQLTWRADAFILQSITSFPVLTEVTVEDATGLDDYLRCQLEPMLRFWTERRTIKAVASLSRGRRGDFMVAVRFLSALLHGHHQ